ncbi:hypothetical protein U3516DRAFT_548880 [Neocallimastix sp. 'constans']
MNNKNIVITIYVLLYFQFINAFDMNKVKSKEEVLKINDEYYISFYCKNETCILVDFDYTDSFIEFPDENGEITTYIVDTCTYDNIKLNNCFSKKCTTDIQCLSNKCIDEHCAFNEETPIVHCDDIYVKSGCNRSSYMHCGKPYGDLCKVDDECSSKCCIEGTCRIQSYGPSDSNGSICSIIIYTFIFIFLFILLIIISIIICCCCYIKYPQRRKYIIIISIIYFTIIILVILYRLFIY